MALLPPLPLPRPPARRVVPAGTREHSLALFSELWEAGCHRGSQELEVSPEVGDGQRMSAPSPLSTRPCQATGASTAQGVSGSPTGCRAGRGGGGGRSEGARRRAKRGSFVGELPLCSGERRVRGSLQVDLQTPLHSRHHGGMGPAGFLDCFYRWAGCALCNLGGRGGGICSIQWPRSPSRLLHQPQFDFQF